MDGVLIDKCPTCEGIWLDGGELEQLARGDGLAPEQILAQAKQEVAEERGQLATGGMCPRCNAGPLKRHMAHGVPLDRCKSCKGLWFDFGELEKVRAAESEAGGTIWGSLRRLLGG